MGRRRDMLPLIGWIVGLVVGVVVFHGLGSGPLSPPPLADPSAWSDWASQREPLVAVMALGRLVVLALAWYLVGATSIGLIARLARAARVVRVADALTVPALRRLLQAGLGLGLATAVIGASTIVPVHQTPEMPAQAIETSDDGGDGSSRSTHAPARPADGSATRIAPVIDGWPPVVGTEPILPQRPAEPAPTPPTGDEAAFGDAVPVGDAVPATGQRSGAMRPLPLELLMPTGSDQEGAVDDTGDAVDAALPVGEGDASVAGITVGPGDGSGVEGGLVGDGSEIADPDANADADADANTDTAGRDATHQERGDAGGDAAPTEAGGNGDPTEATGDGAPPETDRDGDHLVVAGDSLWRIAHDALQERWGRAPTDGEVLPYWREVIEMNRDRLADPDDPDLIFPGQRLAVPPPPTLSGADSGGGP